MSYERQGQRPEHPDSRPSDRWRAPALAERRPSGPPFPRLEPTTVTLDKIAHFVELDLTRVLVWLRDGLRMALMAAVVGAIAALMFGVLGTPRYTVSTDILVDPANLQVVGNDLAAPSAQPEAQVLALGSRLRILSSGNVLLRVVWDLQLTKDREFYRPPTRGLFPYFSRPHRPDSSSQELAALKALMEKVSVSADKGSFIATLMVSSQTASKAITLSGAIVEAFRAELAAADAEAANRATAALDDRLQQLRQDVIAAENAIESFKRDHNLSIGDNGQLVTSQTMTQLNSQLAASRSRVIDAQVTYNALLKARTLANPTQAAVSPALANLLQQAGALQQRLDELQSTFGARHPSILRAQAQLASVREQVGVEFSRATNAAKSELDKANASLEELTTRMAQLEDSVFTDNQSQVQLRELQRDATSKGAIYESFIARTRQIAEGHQVNVNSVRVITQALPPTGRSWPPRNLLLLIAGAIAGFFVGLVLAIARGIIADVRRPAKTLLDP